MAEIFILTGPDIGRSFEVSDGAAFGRSPDCAVRLRDKSISRQHARLRVVNGCWTLSDDGSRNGVFAGTKKSSERIDHLELEDGSEFRLGDVACRFRDVPVAAPEHEAAEPALVPEVELSEQFAEVSLEREPDDELELSDEIELGDEIELDAGEEGAVSEAPEFVVGGGAGRVERPAPRRVEPAPEEPAPQADSDSPEAAPARRPARGQAAASPRVSSGRFLQYHKVEQRSGFLSADLSQYPIALRVLVYLLLAALAAGLAWLAFRGTAAL